MSKYVVGYVVGFGLSALLVGLAIALRVDRWWGSDEHRGAPMLGVVVAVTQLLGELAARVVDDSVSSLNLEGVTERSRQVILVAVVAFSFAGMIEDLLAPSLPGGLPQTLRPTVLARRVLVSLGAAVVTVAYLWEDDIGSGESLIDVAVVLFCANAFIVLNTKPGRAAKVALIAIALAMLGSRRSPDLVGVAMVAGSTTVLGVGELAGRLRLGSAGAGAIGAGVGVGIAMVSSSLVSALVALVAGSIAWMSQTGRLEPLFSDGPLETFDRLGQ